VIGDRAEKKEDVRIGNPPRGKRVDPFSGKMRRRSTLLLLNLKVISSYF